MKHYPAVEAGILESSGDSVLFYIILTRVIGMVASVTELFQPAGYSADHVRLTGNEKVGPFRVGGNVELVLEKIVFQQVLYSGALPLPAIISISKGRNIEKVGITFLKEHQLAEIPQILTVRSA